MVRNLKNQHIHLFSADSEVYHTPCTNCRIIKRKCDRKLPLCTRCLDKKINCCYQDGPASIATKEFKNKNKNEKANLTSFDLSLSSFLQVKGYSDKNKERSINKIAKKSKETIIESKFNPSKMNIVNKSHINSWKPVAFLKKVLHNSKIDKNERIFIKVDGSMEYYGSNIFGNIITIYHSLKSGKELDSKPMIQLIDSKSLLIYPFAHVKLAREHLIREAMNAYFEHYNPYLNYMDEDLFFQKHTSLLGNVVTIIGLRYLSQGKKDKELLGWLAERIQIELKQQFYKPSLDMVITLTLVSQFIGIPSLFRGAYLFTGLASRMAINLGLNQLPPRHKKLSREYLRVRYSTWQMCWFNEKMHALLLNRPTIITENLPSYYFQDPLPLPPLSPMPSQTERKKARNAISLAYYKSLMNLGTMIGFYFACVKIHFPESIEKAPFVCLIMLKRLSKWYFELIREMYKIWKGQPKWVEKLCYHFISYSSLLYHSTRLHLLNYFLRYPDILVKHNFNKEILHSASAIIDIAEGLKEAYFENGTTNRFFALCCAILSLNHMSQGKDHTYSGIAQPLLIRAIQVLYTARFKFPVVEDFFRMIPEVVQIK